MTETQVSGKTHQQWIEEVTSEILIGRKMLEDSLSTDPSLYSVQADTTESQYEKMTAYLAEAEAWLDLKEDEEIQKIDPDLTIPRMNARLKVAVMPHRMLRDKIKGLCQSLHSRMRRAQWRS